MTSSGTYNFENTTIDKVIQDAFEDCGILGSQISGEQVDSARRTLNFMVSEWGNKGLTLWTTKKGMLSIIPGQAYYQLPPGCIDILELTKAVITRQLNGIPYSSPGGTAQYAFDGNPLTACIQTGPDGTISYDYGLNMANCITYVGIQSNVTTTYTLAIEYSYDNINWITTLLTGSQSYYMGQPVWYVLPAPASARSWRIREMGGATLNIQEVYFDVPNYSTLMSRISRSDYISYPNKIQQSPPTAYYVDRQVNPILVIWNTPDNSYTAFVYNYKGQIQDISEMSQTLDSPQRFLDAVRSGLAARLAIKFAPDKYAMLAPIAQEAFKSASLADQEKVPLTIELDRYPY